MEHPVLLALRQVMDQIEALVHLFFALLVLVGVAFVVYWIATRP